MENISVTKPTTFLSYTRASNAKIVFSKVPTFEFLTQKFVLPAIAANTVQMQSRTGYFSRPGDVVQFEKPWNIEILLDENYTSYIELYNWIMSYISTDGDVERDFSKLVTDATIVVLNNNSQEIGRVRFHDVYPIALGSIEYSTTETGIEYMKFNATFDYSEFKIDFGSANCCTID